MQLRPFLLVTALSPFLTMHSANVSKALALFGEYLNDWLYCIGLQFANHFSKSGDIIIDSWVMSDICENSDWKCFDLHNDIL